MAYGQKKTEHAFQAFHNDLRSGDFPPVIFMYGEEEYLIEWACSSLVEKYTNEIMREMDFVKIDEEESSLDKILEACNTFSAFSERKIIWAVNYSPLFKKNCKGFGELEKNQLSDYIDNPNDKTILIFSYPKPEESLPLVKLLKKQCKSYNFTSLDHAQLISFAAKRFKAAGADISREVLKYFIDETGYFNRESEYRIYNLENDIKKLIAYSNGDTITQESVEQTLHGDMDRFVFSFLDAITGGKKDVGFRLLNNILTGGGEVFSIIGLLVNQFELMYEAKELKDDGMTGEQIAKTLKVNGYRVKKAMSAADKLSYKRLRSILNQLYETDRNIKTGGMEQSLALELLIGRM